MVPTANWPKHGTVQAAWHRGARHTFCGLQKHVRGKRAASSSGRIVVARSRLHAAVWGCTKWQENCSAGGRWHGGPFAQSPTPALLGRRAEMGGLARGCPTCRAGGGEGSTPTCAAQKDPHVALIILTTHLWGKHFWWQKLFRAKSCAFGANIRSYTTQRARHGTPFLQPPPPHAEPRHRQRGSSCTAWALRAYCARRGWDTHPSNMVGGDRIISSESISEK